MKIDVEHLDNTVIVWRRRVTTMLDAIRKNDDPTAMYIARKLVKVDTALTELLMEILQQKYYPKSTKDKDD